MHLLSPPGRCPLCWPDLAAPPYNHVRLPAFPKVKADIIQSLLEEPTNTLVKDELDKLTVKELTYHLTKARQTKPHPGNPLVGVSELRKPQLLERCRLHGLEFGGDAVMGEMISLLREHWCCQCSLGSEFLTKSVPANVVLGVGDSSNETPSSKAWSIVADDDFHASPDQKLEQAKGLLKQIRECAAKGLNSLSSENCEADPQCSSPEGV